MVSHRLNTLSDLVRNAYWLRVSCACGHVARLDPRALIDRGTVRLAQLDGRLKCSQCGSRDVMHSACFGPEPTG